MPGLHAEMPKPRFPLFSFPLHLLAEIPLHIPQQCRLLKVLPTHGIGQLPPRVGYPSLQALKLRRRGTAGQPGLGRRLIHQVNGFVRKKTLGKISDGQVHCRRQRLV